MVYSTQKESLIPGQTPLMVEALFAGKPEDGAIKCGLCPRYCNIKPGLTGFCGTRYNHEGKLFAINYGLVSSAHIDPYEKKPLYHFHPGKTVLSLGTFGCNMSCRHCQNSEISQRQIMKLGGEYDFMPPDVIPGMCRQHVTDGVSFTYNEPSIWMEYAVDAAKAVKLAGFNVSFVTNGYMTRDALAAIGRRLDAANVDVKGFNDATYGEISSVANPEEILARCEEMVKVYKIHVEITTNVIPGYNDSDATFRGIAKWMVSKLGAFTPWHLSRYHPAHKLNVEPTPMESLIRGREIGREAGLKFVYLGNIPDPEGDGTKCPGCGRTVVERRGYTVGKINIKDGNCGFCKEKVGVVM